MPGPAEKEVRAANRFLHRAPLLGERAFDDLQLRETLDEHRVHLLIGVHGPEDDLRLRQILLQKAQRSRRVADVTDVFGGPSGLKEDGFSCAGRLGAARGGQSGCAEREAGGGEEGAA